MAPRKWLIVNADDLGQSAGVNRGILRAHEQGIVTSASLMVRGQAAHEVVSYLRQGRGLDVGLHVDLGEWAYAGGAWTPLYQVVTLDDAQAVAREVDSQLAAFRDLMGTNPTHLDSHQHVHLREPVRSVLVRLARELRIPLRRCTRRIRYCGDFYGQSADGSPAAEAISF